MGPTMKHRCHVGPERKRGRREESGLTAAWAQLSLPEEKGSGVRSLPGGPLTSGLRPSAMRGERVGGRQSPVAALGRNFAGEQGPVLRRPRRLGRMPVRMAAERGIYLWCRGGRRRARRRRRQGLLRRRVGTRVMSSKEREEAQGREEELGMEKGGGSRSLL